MQLQLQSQSAIKAVKATNGSDAAVVNNSPVPELKDDFIIAETRAVALNPSDWKHVKFGSNTGTTLGCDWSGVILDVGKNVTKFKPGDEVFGACHGGHRSKLEAGAFAQRVVCKEIATSHKPPHLSFEEAAALPIGLITIGQVMYAVGGLPDPSPANLPKKPQKDILIYGGSSSTGSLAVQFAKLSGYRVLTTASPSNFELLKSRGADYVFDYNDPTSIPAIKSVTDDKLSYIVDCISTTSTAEFCAQVLSSKGGHYHSILWPMPSRFKELRPEPTCKVTATVGYTMLGEPFEFKQGVWFDVDQEEMEFAKRWQQTVEDLLSVQAVKPHPLDIRRGGLDCVLEGMKEMSQTGGPRGKKVVYSLA